jgi:predicted O-methyltransferase YrrM
MSIKTKLKDILENFKLNSYTDKNTSHCYVDCVYEKEFEYYKEKEIDLLEIGIETGASLKLWKEYFDNANMIVGIDIRSYNVLHKFRNIDGVTYYFEDAYTKSMVSKLSKFDIIIDDARHELEYQVKALELYLPLLKDGGIYIVEDIHQGLYPDSKKRLTEKLNDQNCKSYEWMDLRNIKNREDDTLLVIRK